MSTKQALIYGSQAPELWIKTLGTFLDEQADRLGGRHALVVPWQNVRFSYRQLADQSKIVAGALLGAGLGHGDVVGIMAGNRHEYISVFLGAARVGCPVVVLNMTYTPEELKNAVRLSSCKAVFIASKISARNLQSHVRILRGIELPELQHIVCFDREQFDPDGIKVQLYESFVSNFDEAATMRVQLQCAESKVSPHDVLNLQFTSGTTGAPKAAMLTHINLMNNGRFVGNGLRLTPKDVVCCPPPLFHCFGLVLGFLACLSHGSTIVFPADHFDARKVVDSIIREKATVLLGVPTMFVAELEILAKSRQKPRHLRVGLASGAAVSTTLMAKVREQMGISKILIAYGMTETSPITFMTGLDDTDDKGRTIGRPTPHIAAKVIDKKGKIVLRGQRGELCTSGYALQKGYLRNEEKTREVMKTDEDGVRWMHTGDEVMIDDQGFAHITGRIKDIIIRGGENIFPREIEDRLISHPAVSDASVVGLKDDKYGEVVASVLKLAEGSSKPSDQVLRQFVSEKLGRHKAPQHIFWTGDPGVGDDFPKTGSGKIQKHVLQKIGNDLVRGGGTKAKL
ncbi:hypothetical protein B0J13DRAFT_149634 [Dactylonectria estremocensis]|uniref:Uncharacterized protein n=1 Tax=Dactylonectria estremocensis TaxID=1079267 RepID=A0A9P9ILJ5_9HYPO|nr:hypothetical protein B0J13DRAFT_149634 [Dactylonectria estremocensis]